MKSKFLGIALLAFATTISVFAQSKTEKFKVYGNCGMCESRIEKAANSVDGVTAVDWSKETKIMEVSFNSTKTDVHKIHMSIAKVGHDTEMHGANDETYNKLPGCCHYDRKDANDGEMKKMDMKEMKNM